MAIAVTVISEIGTGLAGRPSLSSGTVCLVTAVASAVVLGVFGLLWIREHGFKPASYRSYEAEVRMANGVMQTRRWLDHLKKNWVDFDAYDMDFATRPMRSDSGLMINSGDDRGKRCQRVAICLRQFDLWFRPLTSSC